MTAMSFVGELKFVIFFARLMGVAPYKIVETHLQLSPIAILYSIIVHFVYIYLPFPRVLNKAETSELTRTQMILLIARIALVYSGLSASLISSVTRHREFCAFVNRINKFDGMTNMWRDGITKKREALVWASVLVPIGIRVTMQMYYNYATKASWPNWRWGSSLHDIGLGVIVSRYSIMVSCLLRRFQHLNRLFIAGQANTVGLRRFRPGRSGLHYAWILHADLVEASEELNSMFNYQSSIWISTLAFNVMTKLYNLWNGEMGVETWKLTGNVLSVVHSVLLLVSFLALCHNTAAEANNVGLTLFCSRLQILQNDVDWVKEDTFSIGQYFVLRRFCFISAAGLLRIDLLLLQTIIGLITTYLVILKTSHENSSSKG